MQEYQICTHSETINQRLYNTRHGDATQYIHTMSNSWWNKVRSVRVINIQTPHSKDQEVIYQVFRKECRIYTYMYIYICHILIFFAAMEHNVVTRHIQPSPHDFRSASGQVVLWGPAKPYNSLCCISYIMHPQFNSSKRSLLENLFGQNVWQILLNHPW